MDVLVEVIEKLERSLLFGMNLKIINVNKEYENAIYRKSNGTFYESAQCWSYRNPSGYGKVGNPSWWGYNEIFIK